MSDNEINVKRLQREIAGGKIIPPPDQPTPIGPGILQIGDKKHFIKQVSILAADSGFVDMLSTMVAQKVLGMLTGALYQFMTSQQQPPQQPPQQESEKAEPTPKE